MAEVETVVETNPAETGTEQKAAEQVANDVDKSNVDAGNEEIAKLRAELVKQKEAINKATKEAADYNRALRAKQSEEEIAAEEKKASDEAIEKELLALRKEVAQAKTVKTVMGKLGTDEEVSGKIAEYLYGAEDPDAALTEIQRAWAAKEKAIRLEFGKIPAPSAGGANGEDPEKAKAINLAKEIGRERAVSGKSLRDSLGGYVR